MSLDAKTLYELLPAIHRIRDEAAGRPLRDVLALIARELSAIEENLDQLYDDQFIETCAEWVAPYIGDLIGYRPLHGVSPAVASPRAEVANTIAYRRRKGTIVMLEQLAQDVTDWPAHAVEFFEQLTTTQYMNHVRTHARATPSLRFGASLLSCGGPFNSVAHTPEVRSPESGSGRYHVPNIGIFLWRLRPYRLDGIALVAQAGDASGRKHRINPLGADLRLFRSQRTETSIDQLATPLDMPDPLSIRAFALQTREATTGNDEVRTSDDYGAGSSVVISRKGTDEILRKAGAAPVGDPDALRVVRIADQRDVLDGSGNVIGWAHEDDISADQIAVDPERGRVLLGTNRVADHANEPFTATFHYAFSRDIGGGPYERTPADVPAPAIQRDASGSEDLQPHLDAIAPGGRLTIEDSLTYEQTPAPTFKVAGVTEGPGVVVVVAAKNGVRPIIDVSAPIPLDIGSHGTLVLDGLVITGGALTLPAAADSDQRTLILRDCTLVPGLRREENGDAALPGEPVLVIEHPNTTVRLERCIVGSLHVAGEADTTVSLVDCIVDAGAPDELAYAGDAADAFGADLTVHECTIIGQVRARVLTLASNSIFFARLAAGQAPNTALLHVERKQEGCTRFCYLPPNSIAPRRYHCVPDAGRPAVMPHFTSLRYGDPGYCQLRAATSPAIRRGADDDGEMGVMHACFQPQRETNLRIRLEEYLRFGLRAGIFYAT